MKKTRIPAGKGAFPADQRKKPRELRPRSSAKGLRTGPVRGPERKPLRVIFQPPNREVQVPWGANLLQAAREAGVWVDASCGGNGVCGRCRLLIEQGEVGIVEQAAGKFQLSDDELRQGWRLACQSRVLSDLVVRVPERAQLDRRTIAAPQVRRRGGLPFLHEQRESSILEWCVEPTVRKLYLELEPPNLQDNRSDRTRLLQAIQQKVQDGAEVEMDPRFLKELPLLLRRSDWRLTVTLAPAFDEDGTTGHSPAQPRRWQVIRLEEGDQSQENYGLVIDVGTTTIWGQLLDVNRRETLAEASDYNQQIHYGDDVISRIVHSQKPGGLRALQESVVKTINGIIGEMSDQAGIDREAISHVIVAGNTVMTHLLLGLNPQYIRLSPYTPVANFLPALPAAELGLEVGAHAPLLAMPMVASYVGGDIVSGVLASGLYREKPMTLYIDIGTNGEIVIGHDEWMITAACSAGPAFEGGGIRHGMRATTGAIEDFRLDPHSWEPTLRTIGDEKPKGICGSGLINIVAELLEKGVISANGKFNQDLPSRRIRRGPEGMEFVLAEAGETASGKAIVITEGDIDNLIRAKAAMYAGYLTLLQSVGLSMKDLERVIISGTFGYFVDIERAITIGLLPELPLDRFLFIRNGSLLGVRLASFCSAMLVEAQRIARRMTHVELSEHRTFMDQYVAAMFLPHTDEKEFPGVYERLSRRGEIHRAMVRSGCG